MPTKDDLIVPLEKYFDRLMEEHEKRQATELIAMEKALVLARGEAEKQYAALNNLRKEYTEERKQFLEKGVYEAKHAVIETKMENIHRALDEQNNNFKTWAKLAVAGMALLQLALHFLK